MVDAENKELKVLPERLAELKNELNLWSKCKTCTLKQLQSLIGKLQFICVVVRPGRLFLSRLLDKLRGVDNNVKLELDIEFHKDISWWKKFLPMYNGVGIMWMLQVKQPDEIATSDACLTGMGAVCSKQYLKLQFPDDWKGKNIAILELLAVIVMVKQWTGQFAGKSVLFNVDNEAIVKVLNSGRAREPTLLKLMWELVFVVAGKFEFRAVHIGTKLNKIPDLLSRWNEGNRVQQQFTALIKGKGYREVTPAQNVWDMWHSW